MKAISHTITGWFGGFNDLPDDVRQMFYVAREVRTKAQAPYSNYYVGVALQSEQGNTYAGCNVERASWTQTTHAEQNALDSMVAREGTAKLTKLALIGAPASVQVVLPPIIANPREVWQVKFAEIPVPCGHCLQCIWENCHGDGKVELYSLMPTGEFAMVHMDTAFPLKFGPVDLGVDYSKQP